VQPVERADHGLHPLVKKYRDNIQFIVSGHWHRWFEFGRSFGPQHLVMAATRYDPNAYLIVDVNTHYSKPYTGSGLVCVLQTFAHAQGTNPSRDREGAL
jgi:hypothetical protein